MDVFKSPDRNPDCLSPARPQAIVAACAIKPAFSIAQKALTRLACSVNNGEKRP